jgi:hypothetical protein
METRQVETQQVATPQPEKPQTVLRRAVSWQKAYAGAPVSGLALDLEDAVRELGRQFAQALAPIPQQGVLVLRDGRDAHSGSGEANAGLIKGNRFAVAGHLERATLAWQQVLFDPALQGDGRAYQITAQTVNQLRAAGMAEDVLGRLQPLVGESPLPLVAFRRRVRGAAGEVLPNEGLVLTLADAQAGRAHRSLAAAHENLALVFGLEGRDDVAAYHWAHAWAHDPDPALLERWQALQAKRNVLPGALTGQQAMALYLRIPPPSTARVVPGRFERTVVPAPAFAEPAPQNAGGGVGGASAGAAGSAATGSAAAAAAPSAPSAAGAPAGPQPVALPPPGTSEDSTPGRAAGSGPRAAEGPPSEAPPAPASAPAAQ